MAFDSDEDQFPIKCSYCQHEFTEKLGRLKLGGDFQCPDCGTWLKLDAETFDRVLKDARQSPHDFLRQFTRLKL